MRIFSLATYVPPLSGASRPAHSSSLYLYDSARTHSVATLTDGEAQALVHGHGGDELHVHLRVVSGHHHLGPLGQGDGPGHVLSLIHISEPTRLGMISYAVFCLKKQ